MEPVTRRRDPCVICAAGEKATEYQKPIGETAQYAALAILASCVRSGANIVRHCICAEHRRTLEMALSKTWDDEN